MSTDKGTQQDGEQLFDTDLADDSAEIESNTDDQESESKGEEIEDELSENSEKPVSKAEQAREKQIDAWYKKALLGEVDVNNLPADQKWMKPSIMARLNASTQLPELERLVEQKMAEKETEMKFASLKATVNNHRLSASQRRELAEEFKDLRQSGVAKDKALVKAMKIVGIELSSETAPEEIRRAMKAPAIGGKVRGEKPSPLDDIQNFKTLSAKERIAKLEEIRKQPR